MADEFIQIKNIGNGLRLNVAGTLSVNIKDDLSWSGRHIFSEPVQFSSFQRFLIDQLLDPVASLGTIYWHNGLELQKAIPQQSNKVLLFDGSRVSWSTPQLEYVSGVLSIANGGTGLAKWSRGALVFAPENDYINELPIGVDGQVLMSQNGLPTWGFVGNIGGEIAKGHIPLAISGNRITNSPVTVVGNTVIFDNSVRIGDTLVIDSGINRAFLGIGDIGITIKSSGAIEIGTVKFNAQGVMTEGQIPVDFIRGRLSTSQGGTGIAQYAPGDLLYADAGELKRLAAPNGEGWVLGINDSGYPAWVDMADVRIEGGSRRVRLETDGHELFFVNDEKQRIKIAYSDQPKIHSITPVHLGGTGDDLAPVTRRGVIMVGRSRDAWTAINPGPKGYVLSSNGVDDIPQWIEPPIVLNAGYGLTIQGKKISVDQNKKFNWLAPHDFTNINANKAHFNFLSLKPVSNPDTPTTGTLWTDGDDMYLQTSRGKRSLVNVNGELAPKRIVSMSLAQAINISETNLEACGVIVPFSTSNPLGAVRWKIIRIDVLPFNISGEIEIQLKRNERDILIDSLNVLGNRAWCIEFLESIVTSGDVLKLSAMTHSQSGFVSATVLLEEYHG